MAGKVHFLVMFLFFAGCASSNKTSNPPAGTDVDFLTQIERPDWKQRIDGGDIGYYNPSENTLIGLDEPPYQKGKTNLQPSLNNLSKKCEAHLDEIGSDITKLEFVVAKDGTLRQFFVLESAGPCDADAAASLKQTSLIPAKDDEQTKAALVHLQVRFD